jgi:hypothetical protein
MTEGGFLGDILEPEPFDFTLRYTIDKLIILQPIFFSSNDKNTRVRKFFRKNVSVSVPHRKND